MSSTPKPNARKGRTWRIVGVNGTPINANRPKDESTATITNTTYMSGGG
jgi:hypothetical protein